MKEYKDASNRLSIDLSDLDSDILFRKYANRLKTEFNAKIVEKLDGLDQRYWDFDVDGTIVVLHSDAMAGISIHIEDGTNDSLLRRVSSSLIKE
ncbi:MAG TPA: DUF3630 family protein [Desulfatiglandales bacterium]|nr:DUF3630 family protein [Desulfatiglandales bacterium]